MNDAEIMERAERLLRSFNAALCELNGNGAASNEEVVCNHVAVRIAALAFLRFVRCDGDEAPNGIASNAANMLLAAIRQEPIPTARA